MANRYWNPSADANWADANVWATTFNGDPTGVATPTQNDDCFFTATNSHKCTIGANANCNNLYFDNADNGGHGDYIGQFGNAADGGIFNIYGSMVLSGSMTMAYGYSFSFQGTSAQTLKSNGNSFSCILKLFYGTGGGLTLQDDLKILVSGS